MTGRTAETRVRRSTSGPYRLRPYNVNAFNGRSGTEPRQDHRGRSARPVRCSAWLSRRRTAVSRPHFPTADNVWASRAKSQRPSDCLR